jgi:hypothetical protein
VKALVTILGPREAARQSGLNPNLVLKWATRFKWKKLGFIPRTSGINGGVPPAEDVTSALIKALEKSRDNSTVSLAKYTENAAKKAEVHKDPLSIAKNVRDVAFVHKTLWPNGEKSELIEAAILVGDARVVDNVKELEAASVRENVPHERPAGD